MDMKVEDFLPPKDRDIPSPVGPSSPAVPTVEDFVPRSARPVEPSAEPNPYLPNVGGLNAINLANPINTFASIPIIRENVYEAARQNVEGAKEHAVRGASWITDKLGFEDTSADLERKANEIERESLIKMDLQAKTRAGSALGSGIIRGGTHLGIGLAGAGKIKAAVQAIPGVVNTTRKVLTRAPRASKWLSTAASAAGPYVTAVGGAAIGAGLPTSATTVTDMKEAAAVAAIAGPLSRMPLLTKPLDMLSEHVSISPNKVRGLINEKKLDKPVRSRRQTKKFWDRVLAPLADTMEPSVARYTSGKGEKVGASPIVRALKSELSDVLTDQTMKRSPTWREVIKSHGARHPGFRFTADVMRAPNQVMSKVAPVIGAGTGLAYGRNNEN